MVPSLANHCHFVMFELIAAASNLRFLLVGDPRITRHVVRGTTPIPSSPVNGIVPRIFEGNFPRKVSYQTYCSSALSA